MSRFYEIPASSKTEILQQASVLTGLPSFAVEKDWWVVKCLHILFETEIGSHLVFKGGTSLSKGWGLIHRFSEDIDLAIDRSFFGFQGMLSKNQRTKLRKASNEYITTVLYPVLKEQFKQNGIINIDIELEEPKSKDQDPITINILYPNLIHPQGYLQPKIQLEISCRSLHEPYTIRPILSLVDEVFSNRQFTETPIHIATANPERTFLEKIFLLHEEFQRPAERQRVDRLSRHLYDIYQLAETPFADEALNNPVLYLSIVKHRENFTRFSGVDYRLHHPKTLNPIPPALLRKSWETDYKVMQEQMIYGDSPDFHTLLSAIERLMERIKTLNWASDQNFDEG